MLLPPRQAAWRFLCIPYVMTIVQSTEDSEEGPKAFREKRKAVFEGR